MSAGVVGFVGLGNMGIPMSRRLAAAGYHVRGFDTSEAARRAFADLPGGGVTAVASLGEVAEGAQAVILMLPDSDVVERVLLGRLAGGARAGGDEGPAAGDGLLGSLAPGSVIIDMSSCDPARTRVLAGILAGAGHTLIDAPVSGGVPGARAGTLMIMVGGPPDAFDRLRPLLAAMGKKVVHAGDSGAGHAVKALNNLMSAAHLLASSEALIAGRRFGLDPAVMLEIVNGASGRSGSTENKWPNYVLTERYDAGFPVRLMVKDLRLALGITRAAGVPAAASEAVAATWEAALADLPPEADHTSIARWLASRAESLREGPRPDGGESVTEVTEEFLELPGGRVHLLRGGHGEPVLFLHAAGGAGSWLPFHEQLASAGFEVIAPDHPGFGKSDEFPEADRIDDLVFHYLDVLDALGLDRPHVVGASFGGWIAAELAVYAPHRTGSLTLLSAAGLRLPDHPVTDLFLLPPARLPEVLFHVPPPPAPAPDGPPDLDAVIAAYREATSLARFGWVPFLNDPKLERRLRRVTAPALVLAPADDRLIPVEHARRYAERIPGAAYAEVPECGHAMYFEKPAEFASAVTAFLKEQSR